MRPPMHSVFFPNYDIITDNTLSFMLNWRNKWGRGLHKGHFATMSAYERLPNFDPESDREATSEETNLLDVARSQVYYDSDGETKVNLPVRLNIPQISCSGCVIIVYIGVVL